MSDLHRLFGERPNTRRPLSLDDVAKKLNTLQAFLPFNEVDTSRFEAGHITIKAFLETFCRVYGFTDEIEGFNFQRIHLIALARIVSLINYADLIGLTPKSLTKAMESWKREIERQEIQLPPDTEL